MRFGRDRSRIYIFIEKMIFRQSLYNSIKISRFRLSSLIKKLSSFSEWILIVICRWLGIGVVVNHGLDM